MQPEAQTGHTPEPWGIDVGPYQCPSIYAGHDLGPADEPLQPYVKIALIEGNDPAPCDANARRIVACVNFCAGMSAEEMENIGSLAGAIKVAGLYALVGIFDSYASRCGDGLTADELRDLAEGFAKELSALPAFGAALAKFSARNAEWHVNA